MPKVRIYCSEDVHQSHRQLTQHIRAETIQNIFWDKNFKIFFPESLNFFAFSDFDQFLPRQDDDVKDDVTCKLDQTILASVT